MSGPDHRCPDCGVVDGCVCGPDDGPLVIPCLRPAGECRDAIAALTSELAEARRQLGEVARERDALLDMARDISVYAATSARHGSERSMRDVLTMTANRARSFLLPKRAHGAGEAK